jgi:hypothetical protein
VHARVYKAVVRCAAGYFDAIPLGELGAAPPECTGYEEEK